MVSNGREASFAIGTGDYVEVTTDDGDSDLVQLTLAPVTVTLDRETLRTELEELLADVFEAKDERSTAEQREAGLAAVQQWITENDGTTDTEELYEVLTESNDRN